MRKQLWTLVAVGALAAATGCATAGRQGAAPQGGYPTAEIASLERALADVEDTGELPKLLLARGHAYLLEGEGWLKANPGAEERRRGYERYAGHFLKAITDFERIVIAHADSPEAAEAMFHLGIVHDSENLDNLFLAIEYYRRTVDEYPGTEWARNAQQALSNLRELFHHMFQGAHGI